MIFTTFQITTSLGLSLSKPQKPKEIPEGSPATPPAVDKPPKESPQVVLSPPLSGLSSTSTSTTTSLTSKEAADAHSHFLFARNLLESSERADGVESRRTLVHDGLKWLRKLAQGSKGTGPFAEACAYLGEIYERGFFTAQFSPSRSFFYYSQGAKQNHPVCAWKVACAYELGFGTKRDRDKAVIFFKKAAALGEPQSIYRLGAALLYGKLGLPANQKEGISLLKRVIDTVPEAMYELARCFESSSCIAVIQDEAYALDLYHKAASQDHPQAQYRLGVAYEYGQLGAPISPVKSLEYYKRAAADEHGNSGLPEAQLAISGYYLTGIPGTLPQSETEAYRWARLAGDQQYAKAEFALGHYSEAGIGVLQDMDEAKRWYRRAESRGYRRATKRLAELKRQRNKNSCLFL